jgi:hypothetical protein
MIRLVVEATEKQQLPEAPISLTIMAYYKGFQVLITRRTGEQPILSQIPGVVALINKLEEDGFEPVRMNLPSALPSAEYREAGTEREIPICADHKIGMVWREGTNKSGGHYAFLACPVKNSDGSFCKYKPTQVKK